MVAPARILLIGLLLGGAVGAQFPGRPPGRVPQNPSPTGRQEGVRPVPGANPMQTGQEGVPTVTRPTGTASRTGTGLGYWDALSQMFRRENRDTGMDLGATPARVMLLRLVDNVNLLEPGHKGWERVYWWRKLRLLGVGHRVTTRHRGRAIQAFYDGAYLDCQGTSTWEYLRLDSEEARVRFSALDRVRLEAIDRPLHLEIPGGYTVIATKAIVTIRFDQDRRFFLSNLGPGEVRIVHGRRTLRIGWNECCLLPVLRGKPARPLPPLARPGRRHFTAGEGLWQVGWGGGTDLKRGPRKWTFRADTSKVGIRWGACGFSVTPGRTLEVRSFGRLDAGPARVDKPPSGSRPGTTR